MNSMNSMNCEKMCCCIVEKEIEIDGEIIIDIFGEICNGSVCNFGEKVDIGEDCEKVIMDILSDIEGDIGLCSKCGEMDIIGLDCCDIVCVDCLDIYGDCINGVRESNEELVCSCEVELCMDTDTYESRDNCECCRECGYWFIDEYIDYNGDFICCGCMEDYEMDSGEELCSRCENSCDIVNDRGSIFYEIDGEYICNCCM